MNNSKQDFTSLFEMIPNASTNDIDSLIENIAEIYNSESYHASTLEDWTPSKNTVLELIKLNVQVKDIAFCIDDFKTFARDKKGWTINDNLDAKLITHIKIMEKGGRISFSIPE